MDKKDGSNYKSRQGGIPTEPRIGWPGCHANWQAEEELFVPEFQMKAVGSQNIENDDLQPQHREQIKKLEMCRKEIMHRQPGETVFHPGHFGCLFSYPETLTLTSCGFVPGSSFLDKQLANPAPW
ncbi:hypothetical protein LSAT2_012197 [Lamellibrachia satsuma]|nr:hypothetical protein LSAT2_012197 [Lamellibrachia satsuma]